MTTDLTPAEHAEVEQYCRDLAAEIAGMDAVELGILAERAKVDAEKFPDRPNLETAIKEKARADFAQGKIELREMADAQKKRVDEEDKTRPPVARALHALNREFSSGVPSSLRMFAMPEEPTPEDLKRAGMIGHWVGSYAPDRGDLRFGEYAVPNGRYRVAGSPFVFEIRGARVVAVHAANPENNYGGKDVKAVE